MAIWTRRDESLGSLVHHSDRGVQDAEWNSFRALAPVATTMHHPGGADADGAYPLQKPQPPLDVSVRSRDLDRHGREASEGQ